MSGGAATRRGAVFDLDGTLADTGADLLGAANATLARAGRGAPLSEATDHGVAGRGGKAMLRLGLERAGLAGAALEAEVEALYAPFLAAYEARIAERSRLFPGVVAALDALGEAGWALAVCTNKPERLSLLLLDALGVRDRFAAVLGADSLPVRKPDPLHLWETIDRAGAARRASVLIGDTVTDRETARNAGAPCVLVDFGLSADDPRALAPEAVVRDFAELPDALERLIPRRAEAARIPS